MQSKISLRSSLFILVIAGISSLSIITFFPVLALPSKDPHAQLASPTVSESPQDLIGDPAGSVQRIALSAETSGGIPIRLKIPSINVDAALESVGLTGEGRVDVPKDLVNAAWFNQGPRPGEKGSAVIDGHFGSKNGVPAVFRNLSALQKGDKIYVEDEDGTTTTFVVRELRTYDPDAETSDVFGSNDGKAHLNLITCEGTWDKTEKTFSDRLVVFTDAVVE